MIDVHHLPLCASPSTWLVWKCVWIGSSVVYLLYDKINPDGDTKGVAD